MSGQELGITVSKDEDMGEWYTQVVQKAELADYAPVAGCMIIRPWGMAIWERIRDVFDSWIKEDGVENAYFPLFIPESYLEQEKDIVEGFDPEVAWVTEGGHEELEERLAVRPTSESIIAPYMSKWIRSYRDLPLRLNQWANVVRWEATETRPFLRTKEFLWQEGHTAHADRAGADEEMHTRLEQYERLLENVMAISVMKGRKPEHDKFPGADTTTTVEALMPDTRSLQSATSHNLGADFAAAFDITYMDENQEEQVCHTCSWGLSTRVIGGLIMAHGDDQGLVLPPRIAPKQVVIVPIWQDDNEEEVRSYADNVAEELDGVRVELDDRPHRNPGYKFNEWELKGVPLRLEIGPNEVEDGEVTLVRRDSGEKDVVSLDSLEANVRDQLDDIQDCMLQEQTEFQTANVREAGSQDEVEELIAEHGGYVTVPWCGDESCEASVKEEVHADIVMVPLEDGQVSGDCVVCGDEAKETAYFAKNY